MTNSAMNFGGSAIFANTLRVDQTATFNSTTYFQDAVGSFGAWNNLSLLGGWSNYGSGYQTAQYRKVGDIIQLRGLVVCGGSFTTNIAQMPSSLFYPASGRLIFYCWTSGSTYRIDVTNAGVIACGGWTPTSGTIVSLDGIIFARS